MSKYHINPETGNPGRCTAKKQRRFGGDAAHYSSEKEARDAFEVTQEALTSFQKEYPPEADYDVEELTVMGRMKKTLKEKHGWEDEDFEGMTFTDVESEFLDSYGEEDFRGDPLWTKNSTFTRLYKQNGGYKANRKVAEHHLSELQDTFQDKWVSQDVKTVEMRGGYRLMSSSGEEHFDAMNNLDGLGVVSYDAGRGVMTFDKMARYESDFRMILEDLAERD